MRVTEVDGTPLPFPMLDVTRELRFLCVLASTQGGRGKETER